MESWPLPEPLCSAEGQKWVEERIRELNAPPTYTPGTAEPYPTRLYRESIGAFNRRYAARQAAEDK